VRDIGRPRMARMAGPVRPIRSWSACRGAAATAEHGRPTKSRENAAQMTVMESRGSCAKRSPPAMEILVTPSQLLMAAIDRKLSMNRGPFPLPVAFFTQWGEG
jgi:hypothetical protein